jgi:peptidoglycan/xylan/chitin deacetylase (PgdA/CDA1 family)
VDSHPRDLSGYGRDRPDPAWPGDARVALSLVLNYEEGAERTPLNGDPVSETFLHEIMGEARTTRDYSTESIYEFGSKVGVWRVLDAFDEVAMPLTMFACGQATELNPAPVTAAARAGHEICSHGYRWFDYADIPEDVEREHIQRTIAAIETAVDSWPKRAASSTTLTTTPTSCRSGPAPPTATTS